MAYQIKTNGNHSEVIDEAGKVLFVGSDESCMQYCEDFQVIDYDENKYPITRAILSKFFDMVKDHDNWKDPICAFFLNTNEHQRLMISRAIEFYTGSKAEWKFTGDGYTVTAKGYYLTCGA